MLELIDWLRQLDARFVAAVTSQEPLSASQSRTADVLGVLASEDAEEGLAAFAEKRAPQWKVR